MLISNYSDVMRYPIPIPCEFSFLQSVNNICTCFEIKLFALILKFETYSAVVCISFGLNNIFFDHYCKKVQMYINSKRTLVDSIPLN